MSPSVSASSVRDNGKFFTPEAIGQAENRIAQIRDKYHKDVVIETYAEIPENKKTAYTAETKNQFYADWLRERADSEHLDGIFMLATKQPGHLQVGASKQILSAGLFTRDDRDNVRDSMLGSFKRKEFDQGLLAGVNMIATALDEHSKTTHTSSGTGGAVERGPASGPVGNVPVTGNHWGLFTWLIIGLVGYMILRAIMRMFTRPAFSSGGGYGPGGGSGYGPGGPGYGPPTGSGGGFLSSMLGGAVGGAAGNWFANRMGGSHDSPQSGGPVSGGTGYESSGGDFGNSGSSGGGDFGGGGGGGDFGGGGGGDGGSSGGDF